MGALLRRQTSKACFFRSIKLFCESSPGTIIQNEDAGGMFILNDPRAARRRTFGTAKSATE
jgi:hypothetical protein